MLMLRGWYMGTTKRLFLSLLVPLALMMARPAASLEYELTRLENGKSLLLVAGTFKADEHLPDFVAATSRGDIEAVTFDSSGGNILSAMKVGRLIRTLGLNTVQLRSKECSSACSLAFVGGVERFAEPGSIGVHQSSFAPDSALSKEQAVAGVQMITAEILSFLRDMGVDSGLLNFSLKYGSDDIRYLSASEMRELNVTTSAAFPSSASSSAGESKVQGSRSQEESAVEVIRLLIEGDANIDVVAQLYAAQVSYYGKLTPLSAVISDKIGYFNRWPERYYQIRSESVVATCGNGHCMVSGIYDWAVRSLPRNKHAKGVARFNYTIATTGEAKIIAEAGEVIRE